MISEGERQFLSYWGEKRKRGKWHYAFQTGLLIFAWPVFIFSQLFKYATRRSDYTFSWLQWAESFIVWTVIGFFAFGLVMWWVHERRYQRLQMKNQP
jgi:hypothetical protein